jgi:hypothetical protein
MREAAERSIASGIGHVLAHLEAALAAHPVPGVTALGLARQFQVAVQGGIILAKALNDAALRARLSTIWSGICSFCSTDLPDRRSAASESQTSGKSWEMALASLRRVISWLILCEIGEDPGLGR